MFYCSPLLFLTHFGFALSNGNDKNLKKSKREKINTEKLKKNLLFFFSSFWPFKTNSVHTVLSSTCLVSIPVPVICKHIHRSKPFAFVSLFLLLSRWRKTENNKHKNEWKWREELCLMRLGRSESVIFHFSNFNKRTRMKKKTTTFCIVISGKEEKAGRREAMK